MFLPLNQILERYQRAPIGSEIIRNIVTTPILEISLVPILILLLHLINIYNKSFEKDTSPSTMKRLVKGSPIRKLLEKLRSDLHQSNNQI